MTLALLLLLAQSITYQKSFPGSSPAYMEIDIEETGKAEYSDDPKSENPAQLPSHRTPDRSHAGACSKIRLLHTALESPAKVANMGMKMFRYEKGAEQHETKFNYSEDPDARAIADWFERIARNRTGPHRTRTRGSVRKTRGRKCAASARNLLGQ